MTYEVESLELAKLAETTYFGVCIAFAQEMNRYAERVGGDYSEAIDFFEEVDFLPRQRYFSRLHRRPLRDSKHQTAASNRALAGARSNIGFQ